jgi:hypothetical protein
MTVTEKGQLSGLLDLIHDYWFDAEKVALDRASKSVVLHVERRHYDLATGSPHGVNVTVKNVEDLTIKDTEHVRDYDINEITFDASTHTLVLTGGIPIEIVFSVSALEIHATSMA